MAKKAIAQLHLVCQLHPFLGQEALQTVTHIIVSSWFNYCYDDDALEDYSEYSTDPQCSSTGSDKHA